MRNIFLALTTLLVVGCASTKFETGWMEKLPSKEIELAVYFFPFDEASFGEKRPLNPIPPSDIAALELVVTERLKEGLQHRGLTVSTSLSSLRSDHIWMWESKIGSSPAEQQPERYDDSYRYDASYAKIYRKARALYLPKLRAFADNNPKKTLLFICIPLGMNTRVTYSTSTETFAKPVLFHAGGGSRCGRSVAAVDPSLRLLGTLDMAAGTATEVVQVVDKSYENKGAWQKTSVTAKYRESSANEWGSRIADGVLKHIDGQ